MKAIRIIRPGEPEVLELAELDDPVPGPGQIRVEVHGTALNRADLLQRRGAYPAPPGAPPTSRASSSRAWSRRWERAETNRRSGPG